MIAGFSNKYQIEKAIVYLQRMQYCGYELDDITYINVFASHVKSGGIETGQHIFNYIPCPNLTS